MLNLRLCKQAVNNQHIIYYPKNRADMEVINSNKARDIAAILLGQRHQQKAVRINAFCGSLSILDYD